MTWDLQHLFRLHAASIARALRRSGASAETAEDLAQDAFLRVLDRQPADRGAEGDPRAYLFRTARNLLIDQKRREILARRDEMDDEAFSALPDPSPSTERRICARERLALTQQALAELPPRTRRAFELHRLEGLTLAETAQALGISTTRAWALVRDAYRHIRERLREA
ncbi:sigma-70 family RNA polymerase sigma factor [Neomegalonema sp.]|uniref:RNA polymerase sigma factor n=1 Tax=Neomegalonema sp. TaxID=2039713 RepID=UPI00263392AB|nr:sigma-70 family RNA polymerase sigma factor [Neomegalonema sp.]MDD2867809.1 sigma-70 family RNA polymerase sigma factor [Neomegalonema sp.]